MHKRFITLILALGVVVAGIGAAAPARADAEDVAKVLAGIAALAIIGAAIEDARDDRSPPPAYVPPQRPPVVHVPPRQYVPRPLPPQVARYNLPGQCLRIVKTRYGADRVFGAHCLQRRYAYAASLPSRCAQRLPAPRGWAAGYDAGCLQASGYRIVRH